MNLPTVFDQCRPRSEILAGGLPDSIFAADLWDVIAGKAHSDYQDPKRFFSGTHPTENLKILLRDVSERLAGIEGGNPVFYLETGFGGGKTHNLIAAVHVAREGKRLAETLGDYGIRQYPDPTTTKIAAFVGENSDPLSGNEHIIEGQSVRVYTPWGQIALMAGGLAGYVRIRDNDLTGGMPSREDMERALGDGPVLILIDELVLYMARSLALPDDNPRTKLNTQWPTFLQTLFRIAEHRPKTAVILTLPSEKDANRRMTGNLKQYIAEVHETLDETKRTADRSARNLTPTQSTERAAVLARRLFDKVDASAAPQIAATYSRYLEEQKNEGTPIDNRAFEPGYAQQMAVGYPFHPELIRLFADRLGDIPEFQATRGALRLVARTIRAVWQNREKYADALLLQPHHVDLTQGEIRDEILSRLGRTDFERGLEADVVRPEGGTHANDVETGWPWPAASQSALVVFLHSLPNESRGLTPSEAALAVGRPGVDLAYVSRGLEETERSAWYMRQEGEHFLFRTRASINKRFQERFKGVETGEVRETLDDWTEEIYSGFSSFQVIPFPQDHTAVPDQPERIRLVIVHYDKECSTVGGGERLNFSKRVFNTSGVNQLPRRYRNNLVFLLAESTRIDGLKDAVQSLIAWERIKKDLETEQTNLARSKELDYGNLKDLARRGAAGVPAEFLALESDLGQVMESLGTQELNVRTKLLEAYRVLAFPVCGEEKDQYGLFSGQKGGSLLECYRVDFGETVEPGSKRSRKPRMEVPETPILQCLRANSKLVSELTPENPIVLAPEIVRRHPLWKTGEKKVSTEEIWDRLRREPELPMLLKQTDLLPTFRAGVTSDPESLWVYYSKMDKKVFTRENAQGLSAVISTTHFLYEVARAVEDGVWPVSEVTPEQVWEHLWPRQGVEHQGTVATAEIVLQAKESDHFPVMPSDSVLWRAFQNGARDNRWVLYLRGPNLAIGAQEIHEWPGTPRMDRATELWAYQTALDQGIYPRKVTIDVKDLPPLTPENLKTKCWPQEDQIQSEELERKARGIWRDLSRPQLENALQKGISEGYWGGWHKGGEEAYYTKDDPSAPVVVAPDWVLVNPDSRLGKELEPLRPGKGPQPVQYAGTPREALTSIWEQLGAFKGVQLSELTLTMNSRDTFDNTIRSTWADRPGMARAHVTVTANGQRAVSGQKETIHLDFEGRVEELGAVLSPVWPFERQGELDIAISVHLLFDTALDLNDSALETYKTAIMNANQGTLEARAVPCRRNVGGNE
jgi:hypothetical protein